MGDRWIVDEEWVRHIRASGEDVGIYDMNMGLSKKCNWCNNRCTLDGYTLLHNVKSIRHQKVDPTKVKKMRFYYVLSLGKEAPTIPSAQSFYQDLWNGHQMSKRSLKRTAQDSKQDHELLPSKKQARPALRPQVEPHPTLKEKEGTEKVSKMMSTYDTNRTPNAQERITGEDIPPRLLGYFPYRSLCCKKNKPELMKELGFRNLEYDDKEGVRNLQGILKEAEQSRLKKELASELLARGFQSDGIKIPSMIVLLKHDCVEKSESTGGKYSIDFSKFFFKLCPDIDETIFEEQE